MIRFLKAFFGFIFQFFLTFGTLVRKMLLTKLPTARLGNDLSRKYSNTGSKRKTKEKKIYNDFLVNLKIIE